MKKKTNEELIGEIRTGLMASAAFVRGNSDGTERMSRALDAFDEMKRRLTTLDERAEKYKWQVRDTYTRAVRAEGLLFDTYLAVMVLKTMLKAANLGGVDVAEKILADINEAYYEFAPRTALRLRAAPPAGGTNG